MCGILNIDGVAHRSVTAVLCVDGAIVRAGDVVDLLVELSLGIEPALDDLHAVEIGTIRVTQSADHQTRGLALGRVTQVAAHGHPVTVPAPSAARLQSVAGFLRIAWLW